MLIIYIYHDISYHDNNVICGYHPYIRVYIYIIYIYILIYIYINIYILIYIETERECSQKFCVKLVGPAMMV